MNTVERFLTSAAVVVAVGGGVALDRNVDFPFGAQRITVHKALSVDEVAARVKIDGETNSESVRKALGNYAILHNRLAYIFQDGISVNRNEVFGLFDKKVTAQIDQKAREHVVFGANVLKEVLPKDKKDQVQVKSYNDIEIDGLKFDLDDKYQFYMAGALVNAKLRPHTDRGQNATTSAQAEINVRDLKWLNAEYKNIVFEPGAFAVMPEEYLINISRMLQELRRNKFPFPQEIQFVPYVEKAAGGAWYYNSKIAITNRSTPEDIYHEVGHLISDASKMKTSDNQRVINHSQAEFDKIFPRLQAQFKTDKKLYSEKNTAEEYAEMFKNYVQYGVSLRRRIIPDALKYNSVTGETLLAEYQFMKDLFGGVEFRRPFEVVEHLDPKVALSSGNVLSISDVSITHPGVLLRPMPSLAKDPEYPLVNDGDTVRIISGPQTVTDSDGKKVEMWRVERVFAYSRDRYEPSSKDARGWMSREWFGELLK